MKFITLFLFLLVFTSVEKAHCQALTNSQTIKPSHSEANGNKSGLNLYVWQPSETLAPLIIPVRSNESPKQAALRYLSQLERNTELMELFEGHSPILELNHFRPLNDSDKEHRALLIANLPKDYTKKTVRVENFVKLFGQEHHNSYLLPIAANLGLGLQEKRDFFKLIAEKFPMLVAMGGDDVDPKFYNQDNFHAGYTNKVRDEFEIQLIKSYVAEAKGFLFSVCRGAQISAVALGYSLLQDVPFHVETSVPHANDWHNIQVLKTAHNILSTLLQTDQSQLFVNSLHHQSILFRPGGLLQIAALGLDGVIEALEFWNGRGLLLQFHPELMNNLLGFKIVQNAIKQKNQFLLRTCEKVHMIF